ncbi:MAG: M1 family metallopeptidase [Acidobacteriales bacterium]|nr:M1 family metallopeptidase [Terriglobales bacterium]
MSRVGFARVFALLLFVPFYATLSSGQAAAPAAQSATFFSQPLSERVVAYQIDARVDAKSKTIDATETLTYHNLTGQPQDTFPFHLYLNAFQPQSTFVAEAHRGNSDFKWEDKYYAAIDVKSLEVVGMGDLTSQMKFISPDDGNTQDHTVFQVKLPRPVAAGDSVQFKIAFHDRMGEVLARTGYKRDFIMGGQWFPKVGVWWQGAWNCHQFHRTTEFFADYGTFDVRLTVPQNEVVGASGIELSNSANSDGTRTYVFRGEDIHDFAWTAEPEFRVYDGDFQGSAGKVHIRLLMQPGHVDQAALHMQVMQDSMKRFDQWYGPYPYKQITVVDPPHGGFAAGGMEYPTLITGDTTWWMPDGLRLVALVVEHEFGHQYWYGMVGSNEFENAWLDEGINSYSEVKVLNDIYGQDRSVLDLWHMTMGEAGLQRNSYIDAADKDPMNRFAYQYLNGGTYADITYGKTATVLLTLEKVIGEETLRQALHTYFMRFRFKHPTQEDFLKTVEEVSGKNLRWYFDQAVYGTQVLDYQILRANSWRQDWYVKNPPDEKKGDTMYHTEVVVHRKQDFIFPVEVLVKFDNGDQVHESWDGKDRWVRYSYDKKAKLVSAEIDPGHGVWLDKDFYNNSYSEKSEDGARHKLSAYWLFLVQFVEQWLAWLV